MKKEGDGSYGNNQSFITISAQWEASEGCIKVETRVFLYPDTPSPSSCSWPCWRQRGDLSQTGCSYVLPFPHDKKNTRLKTLPVPHTTL